MSISATPVQKATSGQVAAGLATATFGATPTNGNLLVAWVQANIATLANFTITGWTRVGGLATATGANLGVACFAKIASSDVAAVVASATGATSMCVQVWEWNSTTGWVAALTDQTQTNDGGASGVTTLSTGTTAATLVQPELAMAAVGLAGGTGTVNAWTQSFTSEQNDTRLISASKVLGATGTVETTASWTTSRVARACVVTFRAIQNYTTTVTDAEGMTDSRSLVGAYARAITNAEGLTDSRSLVSATARSITDPLGMVDAITTVRAYVRSLTDPLGMTDAATAAQTVVRVISDALGLTDAINAVTAAARAVTDGEGLSDAVAVVAAYGRSATDPLGMTDGVAYVVVAAIVRTITDAEGLTDSVAVTVQSIITRSITDALTLNDRVRWLQTVDRAAGCAVETPTSRAAAVAAPTTRSCPAPSVGPYGNRRT